MTSHHRCRAPPSSAPDRCATRSRSSRSPARSAPSCRTSTSAPPRATRRWWPRSARLLLKHRVLFFRDQDITRAEHVAFARRFGELEDHPVAGSDPEHPGLVRIYKSPDSPNDRYENSWHTDATWREKPPFGCVLRCVECPPVGGDTMWANMVAGLRAPARARQDADRRPARPPQHRGQLRRGDADREAPGAARRSSPTPSTRWCARIRRPARRCCSSTRFTTHFTNFHTPDNVRYGQDYAPGAQPAAAVPDQPGAHPRVPGALPLEAEQRGDLGQPLAPSTTR